MKTIEQKSSNDSVNTNNFSLNGKSGLLTISNKLAFVASVAAAITILFLSIISNLNESKALYAIGNKSFVTVTKLLSTNIGGGLNGIRKKLLRRYIQIL